MKRTPIPYLRPLAFLAAGLLASACIIVTDDDDDDDNDTSSAGRTSTSDAGAAGEAEEGTGGSVEGAGGAEGGAPEASAAGSAGEGAGDAGAPSTGAGGAAPAKSGSAQLEGASFVDGTAPDAGEDLTAPAVEAPQSVIAGGTADYIVTLAGTDLASVLIQITGDDGYFVVPATGDSGQQTISVTLLPDYAGDTLGIGFALQDTDGNVSPWTTKEIPVVETSTGDVKVSLTFDQDEDVDLWVTDPLGNKIYYGLVQYLYGNTEKGAHLDLDSNASCNIDGVNNENIFWDSGSAPSGEYQVQVNYFARCAADSVNYTVTVSIGDNIRTYSGSFAAADVHTTHDVTTFTY